jgi:hypothetical protein
MFSCSSYLTLVLFINSWWRHYISHLIVSFSLHRLCGGSNGASDWGRSKNFRRRFEVLTALSMWKQIYAIDLCYRDDRSVGPQISNAGSAFMCEGRAVQPEQPRTVVAVLVGLCSIQWAPRHRVTDQMAWILKTCQQTNIPLSFLRWK